MEIPRLYAIMDAGLLAERRRSLPEFAGELAAAGVKLLQLRDKGSGPQTVLRNAVVVQETFAGEGYRLILNDWADLAVLAGWGGVHVGQEDLSPADARRVVGAGRWVGVSTHTEEQVRAAERSCANYVAVGPVFATRTKRDASPVVGLDLIKRARALTSKPLVAIGGMTRENARSVIAAGADSVAVISGLLVAGESVERVARDFLEILG